MFAEQEPVNAKPESLILADAMLRLVASAKSLESAKERVPDYTAQWRDEDYYAQEQETFNRAADAYADAVKSMMKEKET